MTSHHAAEAATGHTHVFLGAGHEKNERRTWIVIGLCGAMMLLEIGGGVAFGSIALVADGLHMSTHAGALLLAALAYTYARRYAQDDRFTFGTGKLGDLAGFTSAVILAMIALLIGYEAVTRFLSPVPIHFAEAIPIAVLGLGVNVTSAWLLSGGEHGHHHGHSHGHGHSHDHHDGGVQAVPFAGGSMTLEIFETDTPPRFRLRTEGAPRPPVETVTIETTRPDGRRQRFNLVDRGRFFESLDEIPEPHAFTAKVQTGAGAVGFVFAEDEHGDGAHHRDNNMRAAMIHVMADAAVSVLVITGLILARLFGWLWMDPLAGLVGALVIASWSYGLIRDTGAILLDMSPDRGLADTVRHAVEAEGDDLTDVHIWRLGPGHLGAIVSIATRGARGADYYRERFARLQAVSHLTVEVLPAEAR